MLIAHIDSKKKLPVLIIISVCLLYTVPLPAQDQSTTKAILLSAVMPGAGQMYLGRPTRAGVFFGAELMVMMSYLRLNQEVDWKQNTYMLHANRYADVPLNSEDSYYRFIANYVNSDEYNAEVEREFRNLYIIHNYNPDAYRESIARYSVPEDKAWHWESRDSWLRYREIRREKQEYEILANFALGASVLNRLISIIDTALIARSTNTYNIQTGNTQQSFLSDIYFEPDYLNNGITLKYNYSFY